LRQEIGLPAVGGINPLTDWCSPQLHLALFSKQLLDKQPDWPGQTVVTGFPWFDQGGRAGMSVELSRFLDDGPPPIVFTLGTAVVTDARTFYETSARAASLLGRRAVLILKDPRNRPRTLPDGVAACDHAPFSALFPRAAAIVHHGGIGTTGLAMRFGRPMLVMPCAWDQPDNAERAARLSISRTIPAIVTLQPASQPSCGACSTILRTNGEPRRSANRYGRRTAWASRAGPYCDCFRRASLCKAGDRPSEALPLSAADSSSAGSTSHQHQGPHEFGG
jgi:hypothetical protein